MSNRRNHVSVAGLVGYLALPAFLLYIMPGLLPLAIVAGFVLALIVAGESYPRHAEDDRLFAGTRDDLLDR